ncbi:MAG TPA: CHAT domain-containing protein, partial [Cyclobacteriaceae bacterium]|nr:CHAT domain-containing protein [Cyclobacteriaceae bacterium]
ILLSSFPGHGQDVDAIYQQGFELLGKEQYNESIKKFEAVLRRSPAYADADSKIAWCQILLGRLDDAQRHADLAYQKDPVQLTIQAVKGYMEMLRGNMENAKKYMRATFLLCGDNEYLKYFEEDFLLMKSKNIQPALCDQMLAWIPGAWASRSLAVVTFEKYMKQITEADCKNVQGCQTSARLADEALKQFPPEFQFLTPILRSRIGERLFTFSDGWRDGLQYFEGGWTEGKRYGPQLPPLAQFNLSYSLANYYLSVQDYEKTAALTATALNNYILPEGAEFYTGNMVLLAARSASNLSNLEQMKTYGAWLLKANQKVQYPYFELMGNNFLGMAFLQSDRSADRKKALDYLSKAYDIAIANDYAELKESVMSNLALCYWQAGDRTKAKQVYRDLIQIQKQRQDWYEAEISLNNLAGLLYYGEENGEAIPILEEAIAINEKARQNLPANQRIQFMQRVASSYRLMVGALARMGDARRVFEVQNRERARVLEESLYNKNQVQTPSLQQFQQQLKQDEAAVFYSVFEAGVVIVNIVTRTSVQVKEVKDFNRFLNLKAQVLEKRNAGNARPGYKPINREALELHKFSEQMIAQQLSMTDVEELVEISRGLLQKSDAVFTPVRQRYLRDFYDFLIAPVESYLTGIKRLLIFPDGILNFLPFEALQSADGKYLVEKFDVRYCQSASIFNTVNMRTYPSSRKSFLGMGGAQYERMAEKNNAKGSLNDDLMVQFQIEAEDNAAKSKSQRNIYATLFTGDKMNYLPGTLMEVENLRKIFTDGTVLTGKEMTENRMKTMSQSGELAQYKILHLATHGFALSELPPLSGVAMCIFTNMQNGEDGYLTAPEISKLNLKADLVVLSACETGLGRIYGGEGVVGLTGSLLQAGANEVYVSLWPVNDEGTMTFMTGMYDLVVKQRKSYAEAGDIMKRAFIAGKFGEEFKAPSYWAPFVHYGR